MLPLLLLLSLPLHFVLFALLSCYSLATLAHVNYATTTTTTSLGMYGTRMYPLQPLPAPPLSQTRLCRCGPRPSREDLDSLEILIRLIQFLIHGVCTRHTHSPLPVPLLSLSLLWLFLLAHFVGRPCLHICRVGAQEFQFNQQFA